MKYAFLLIAITLVFSACNSSKENQNQGTGTTNAEIAFEDKNHDFGTLTEGDVVVHSFKFKNIGSDPLQILDVQVSCGCTVAAKPEGLIGVGQEDEIKIQFNSQGKVGSNKKSVGIITNAKNNEEILNFTAIVLAKPETE